MAFLAMFTIGGLSGITHAVSPHDRQQTDTYYVVAHFHYVLFGGALFGIMGGIYYWWPKVFGVMLDERLGKLNFWTWLIGFNLAFGPMHLLGLQGMPRRIYTYDDSLGLDFWNMVSTVGAFIIALSVMVFMYNVRNSHRRNRVPASGDPWDARTLEWSIASPPPHYNFAEVPVCHSIDEFWHRKYSEDDEGRPVRVDDGEVGQGEAGQGEDGQGEDGTTDGDEHGSDIHMPSPSYFPLVAAFGLPVMAYGMVYGRNSGASYLVAALGALILLSGLYGWAMEPSTEPEEHGPEPTEVESGPDGGEPALVAAPSTGAADEAASAEAEGPDADQGHGADRPVT